VQNKFAWKNQSCTRVKAIKIVLFAFQVASSLEKSTWLENDYSWERVLWI